MVTRVDQSGENVGMTTGTWGRPDPTAGPVAAVKSLGNFLDDRAQDYKVENAKLTKEVAEKDAAVKLSAAYQELGEVREDVFLNAIDTPPGQTDEDMTPAEREGVARASALYARSQKMIEQGQSQAAAEALLNHKAIQLAKKYPTIGKEIFAAARGIETASFKDVDADYNKAKDFAQNQANAVYEFKLKTLMPHLSSGQSYSPAQVDEMYEKLGYGNMMRSAATIDAKLKVVQGDASLNEATRTQNLREVVRSPKFAQFKGTLFQRITDEVYNETDPVARERKALEIKNQLMSRLASPEYGGFEASEIQSYMGDVLTALDGAAKYSPEDTQYKALDLQNKTFTALAVQNFNMTQSDVSGTLAVAKQFSDALGFDFIRSQALQNPALVGGLQGIAKGTNTNFPKVMTQIATRVYAIQTGRSVEEVTGGVAPQVFDYSAPIEAQQADLGQASQVYISMLLNPSVPDKEAIGQAFADMATQVGNGATTGAGNRRYETILDQMSADGFVEVVKAQPVLGARLQDTADDALTGYTKRLMADSEKMMGVRPTITPTSTGVLVSIPEDASLSMQARMKQESVRSKLEAKLNVGVRALAHTLGTKDYETAGKAIASQWQ